MSKTNPIVVITGGSGFIAVHTMLKLLQQNYQVRASLRQLSRADEVRQMLQNGGLQATRLEKLEFFQADLTQDSGWQAAMTDADYLLHIASPTPATRPDDADAMVKMAVNGTLRVLTAAKNAGIKRVVMTSASGAVLAGHKRGHATFTENDWSNLDAPYIDAYQRSKTLAEKAAWDFANAHALELVTILPTAVMGPILGADYSHSNGMIRQMLEGKMPLLLNLAFDYVDVRDVADLQLLAMTRPEAKGQRFLATSSDNISYRQLAQLLRDNLGDAASKVSSKVLPDFAVKFLAHFNKTLKMPASFLDKPPLAATLKPCKC